MIIALRKLLGREISLQKGFREYSDKITRLDSLTKDLDVLGHQYKETTDSFNKVLNQFPELENHYNKRYNVFFSDYISEVQLIKGQVKQLSESIDNLKSSIPFFQPYLDLIASVLSDEYKFKYEKYLAESLEIERESLPQISKDNIDETIEKLKDENITVNKVQIPVNILKPSQAEFNHDKIKKFITNEDQWNWGFEPIISKDLYLIDQHHRWAAMLELDEDEIIDAWMINLPIEELIDRVQSLKKAALTILEYAFQQGQIDENIILEARKK